MQLLLHVSPKLKEHLALSRVGRRTARSGHHPLNLRLRTRCHPGLRRAWAGPRKHGAGGTWHGFRGRSKHRLTATFQSHWKLYLQIWCFIRTVTSGYGTQSTLPWFLPRRELDLDTLYVPSTALLTSISRQNGNTLVIDVQRGLMMLHSRW